MARFFDDEEFTCKCCDTLPPNGMDEILVEHLDKLRALYGDRIMVSSGYRCPKHNADVGGVKGSYHTKGLACDIYVDGDYEEFYDLVISSRLFDAVGHYPENSFVHVDMRARGEMPNYYLWEA